MNKSLKITLTIILILLIGLVSGISENIKYAFVDTPLEYAPGFLILIFVICIFFIRKKKSR